jgi:hypothetical protein
MGGSGVCNGAESALTVGKSRVVLGDLPGYRYKQKCFEPRQKLYGAKAPI